MVRLGWLTVVVLGIRGAGAFAQASPIEPSLDDLLVRYFRAEAPGERDETAKAIAAAAKDDAAVVAAALRSVNLWSPKPGGSGQPAAIPIKSAELGDVTLTLQLPSDYSPERRWPLVISRYAQPVLCGNDNVLRPPTSLRLLASAPLNAPSIHEPHDQRARMEIALRLVRTLARVDEDDVHYVAHDQSAGGEALMAAVTNADELASSQSLVSGGFGCVFPEQLFPMLLGNTRHVAIDVLFDVGGAPARWPASTAHLFIKTARDLRLPTKAAYPLPTGELAGWNGDAVKGKPVGEMRRPAGPVEVSHWFRYPEHGRAYWLRCTKFRGDVWESDQIDILPAPVTDRDAYISEILKSQLGYLGGRIDGQTITLETRRCEKVEILLGENFVDFSKPVVVRINGRTRHEGVVKPSIADMLEHARDEWRFQHPVMAKLRFDVRMDAE